VLWDHPSVAQLERDAHSTVADPSVSPTVSSKNTTTVLVAILRPVRNMLTVIDAGPPPGIGIAATAAGCSDNGVLFQIGAVIPAAAKCVPDEMRDANNSHGGACNFRTHLYTIHACQ
jgi:hypothetical protein